VKESEDQKSIKIFSPDALGTLISRPNRFIVIVKLPEGNVRAHCPNPGRLIELMNPGRTMILEKSRNPERKTGWTLAAAEYKNTTVSLFSARANAVAGELIIPELFPHAREIKAEYSWGNSRFDWHFFSGEKEIFLEVKACTLIEEGTAMFPDAPSLRASRHLEELSLLKGNREAHVVFVIMSPHTRRFIPNMHTDPDFARRMFEVRDKVCFHGVSASCTSEGDLRIVNLEVPVITRKIKAVEKDSGIYMILIKMEECSLRVGSLGVLSFKAGWYVYAGSALKNLKSRVSRHLRKRKKMHWHVDYLLAHSEKIKDLPIYTLKDMECDLAAEISSISEDQIHGFGCSDCLCPSHLFFFEEDPLQNRNFLDLLFHYRHTLAFD
jgi:sugar fermentation stimulation protein A